MLKVIQVGVGGYGAWWLPTVSETDAVTHVGLVDVNLEALREARKVTGISKEACFASVQEAVISVDADALLCVVPPAQHEEVIGFAFDAGLHVLSEKPIADTPEAAQRILNRAQLSDRILMISQKARFHPWVRKFKELVTGGGLGRMSHVTHFFRAPYYSWGEFRHAMDDPLFLEMSIHHFDLMRALLGRDATEVWATTWNTPYSTFYGDVTGLAHFIMQDDLPVTYHADAVASGDMTDWYGEIRAVGETGTLTMVFPDLYIARKGADHEERIAPREAVMTVSQPQEGQRRVLEEFIMAVAEGRQPESDVIDNIKSLAMVFGAIESSRDQQVKFIKDYLP